MVTSDGRIQFLSQIHNELRLSKIQNVFKINSFHAHVFNRKAIFYFVV
jgi:hypothetical protein